MTRQEFWAQEFTETTRLYITAHYANPKTVMAMPPEDLIEIAAHGADLALAEYDKRFSVMSNCECGAKSQPFPCTHAHWCPRANL